MLAGSHLTVDALDAVRSLDIAVPEALSIVGFNDSAALGWWGAGVTSVGLPVFNIAEACAGGLLGKLRQRADASDDVPRPPSERDVRALPRRAWQHGAVGPRRPQGASL